jgi:hypothetical protein
VGFEDNVTNVFYPFLDHTPKVEDSGGGVFVNEILRNFWEVLARMENREFNNLRV